jgi:GH18 family chitinase
MRENALLRIAIFFSFFVLFHPLINAQFKVVGYIPNWIDVPTFVNNMDMSKVTHINYCFQNPNANGDLIESNNGLQALVNKAHANNVKVLVSLCGGGASQNATTRGYYWNLISPANRNGFIQKISAYVSLYNLDGIDVDIEGDAINGDYDGFAIALANALQPQGKLVTAAIKSDYGNPNLINASLSKFDFVNVMAYDQVGSWDATPGQHSSYSYSTGMVEYWHGRGVPYSRICLGLPFYGYGWNSNPGNWTYAQVLASFPGSQNSDQAGNIIYYNGMQTIKDKTNYACTTGLGGVMIWELTNDAPGPYALLDVVNSAANACGPKPTVTITSPANNASFSGPANITINANATTPSGSITKVEFFNGSTLLGSDNSAPYSYTWNNVASGVYTINVRATNSSNATATASIVVHVTGPHGGTPWPIPGKVEAEDFDDGGQGFAYNDVDAANNGGAYRATEAVDIEAKNGGGYDVGWTAAGEWMNYTVNVASSGVYNFQFNIATTATGKSFHVEMDGNNVTGAVNLPNTGAWTTFQLVTVNNVSLSQGQHTMRVYMDTDGFNLDYINVVALPNPTITFNSLTKTYGDPAFNVAATSNSSGAITYSITSGSQYATITSGGQVTIKGAGTVTIQASQAAAAGYNSGTATATLTINKAALTITADNKSKVYNTANPTLTMTYGGLVNGDNSAALSTQPTISTTAVTGSNAGTYPISLTGGTAANYNITLVSGTLTVTQGSPTLTYTGATNGNQGSSIALTATSNSTGAISYTVTNGTGAATLSGSNLNLTQAGTVTLTINVAATQNYAASSITQTITINALVNPTITFGNLTKTYGDPAFTVAATSNSSGAITYSISSGSEFASITAGGQVTIKGAGSVTIQASQAASANFSAATATATLTINKASLTITADNQSKVYNTANPSLTMNYSGFVNGDNSGAVSVQPTIATTAVTASNVGTYPITLAGGSATNYNITLVNGTLTVTQATPTLSYTGATSGNQGSTISLSATSNSTGLITYSVVNETGAASVAGSSLYLTQTGSVSLTVSVASTQNYTAASIQIKINVNALGVPTITLDNITKTYGDPVFTVSATSDSPGAITYSIISGAQFATITSNGQITITGAGTVSIKATQAASGSFSAGSATAVLTITKATLTVTADDKTKIYNTANPVLTRTYSGFVYGQTASNIVPPSISTSATSSSDVGTYAIVLTGGSSSNYTFVLVNGTLAITQATPTLNYLGLTTGSVGQAINLLSSSNSTGTIVYTVTNGTGAASVSGTTLNLSQQGTVTLTITVQGTVNYKSVSIDKTITINGAPTFTFDDITKTYGDADFTVQATSNSAGAITYSISSGSQYASITSDGKVTIKGAGTVVINATQAASGSYTSGTTTATLVINKAILTVTADDKSKQYNTVNPVLTRSFSGFVYGQSPSVLSSVPSIATSALKDSDVGVYPITLVGGSSSNYDFVLIAGSLTITQATPPLVYDGETTGDEGTSIALSVITPSTGDITYTITNGTGTATLSGETLSLTQAGTVTLTITLAPTTNYSGKTIQQVITINSLVNPTITFVDIVKTYGDPNFTVAAISNSPGTFTYTITSGNAFASISSSGEVTILGAGSVTIQATQQASSGYNSGIATATLTINKAAVVLTYTGPTSGKVGEVLTLTATSSSSGAINYSVVAGGTGSGTIAGNQLSLGTVGQITLQVTAVGDANHTSQTITQVITITTATGVTYAQIANGHMEVYPNPVVDVAKVDLQIPNTSFGKIVLCDINGQVVKVIAEGEIASQTNYEVPMAELASGLYILKLYTENGILVQKLTK